MSLFLTKQCRYGVMKYLASDYGVGQMLTLFGEYFEGEVALFRKLLREGDIVVSAGGNIGVHIIPMSQIVGAAGRIITFEPQKFIHEEILMENLEKNGCINVDVWSTALGEVTGEASFPQIDYSMPNNFGGMELRDGEAVKVEVMPLDDMHLTRLDMLMLDIEGYELAALKGAHDTIMRCRPYLYIEIDREPVRESILAYCQEVLNYQTLYHTPRVFDRNNFAGNPENKFGNMVSIMALGIPM